MTDASGRRLQRAPRLPPARPRPAAAQQLLGAEHPLARAEHRVRWLGHQAATLAALLPVGALALLAGAPGLRAGLLAGGLVEAWLLVALSAAAGVVRDRALDLIVEGRSSLPLASVRRRRARLMRPRHVRLLAEAIEALRREARCPYRRHPSAARSTCPPSSAKWTPSWPPQSASSALGPTPQLSVASSGYSAEQPPRYTETSQSACERSLRVFTSAPPRRTTAPARIRGRHATVGIEVPTPDVQLDRDASLWRPCAGKGGDAPPVRELVGPANALRAASAFPLPPESGGAMGR